MRRLILLLLAGTLAAQVPSPQVPITGTIGAGGIFPLLNSGTISLTDANHSMTYLETTAFFLSVGSSVPLTAVRTITAPSVLGFCYDVENLTTGGFGLLLSGTTGTGPTIPNGKALRACYDGSNYVAIGAITVGTTNISPGTPVLAISGLSSLGVNLGSNPNAGLALTGSSTYGTHFPVTDGYLGNTWYQGTEGTNQANYIGDYCITNDSTWLTCQLAITASGIIPSHIYSLLNCAYVQTTGNPAQCAGETNGSTLILAGSTSVQINTTAVTAGSQIMITVDTSLGGRFPGGTVTCNSVASQGAMPMYVSARTAGASFTVTTTATSITTNPACFSWMIVN